MVQWLGLDAFSAAAQVQSLVKELRSCKLCGIAKKTKNTNKKQTFNVSKTKEWRGEKKKKVSFPPPWEFQTPIPLGTSGPLINLPRT